MSLLLLDEEDATLTTERAEWHREAGLPDLPAPTFPDPPRRWEAGTGDSWRWLVLLDGSRVEQALTADVDAGCVTEAVLSARGILDVKEGYSVQTRCGVVEIVSWREFRHVESIALIAILAALTGCGWLAAPPRRWVATAPEGWGE